jgi:hypothetical protein
VQEICTLGSAWGDEFKRPRSLARKRQITARLRKGLPLQGSSLPSFGFRFSVHTADTNRTDAPDADRACGFAARITAALPTFREARQRTAPYINLRDICLVLRRCRLDARRPLASRFGKTRWASTFIDRSYSWQTLYLANEICEQRRGIVLAPHERQRQRHVQVDHG